MRTTAQLRVFFVIGLTVAPACTSNLDPGGDDSSDPEAGADAGPVPVITDPLDGLPTGSDAWAALCAKGYTDTVSKAFCTPGTPPAITSFAELRALLGLGGTNIGPTRELMVTGVFQSTAVSGRFVTPLNPRMILTSPTAAPVNPTTPQPMPAYNIIAFSRGELFAELASKDPTTGQPRFFLFRFYLDCESKPEGCNYADVLTPTTESGWTGYSIYDDEAIGNTTLDCLRCHQPDGPGTTKFLRMQELRGTWNHWFYEETPQNLPAIVDFEEAHVGELYAGTPAATYRHTRPIGLQALIQNNGPVNQPNEYKSMVINSELSTAGSSATWNALYAEYVAGRAIPVPMADTPGVDTSKMAAMKQSYLDTVNGVIAREDMPDIRDVFADAAMDVLTRPAPGLDAVGIMTQVCSQCHNPRLDQSISRANFTVANLANMSRTMKDKAIARLGLDDDNVRKMPPARFYTLSDSERDLLITELSK